jgi:hypothetical protein
VCRHAHDPMVATPESAELSALSARMLMHSIAYLILLISRPLT